MANLSKLRRERMLGFLEELRKKNATDEDVVNAVNEIENEINEKRYGLVWEEHTEEVDERMKDEVPIFVEDHDKEITTTEGGYNFLLEGDNLHSLHLLEKTHKEKIDVIYIDPPYNTGNEDFVYNDKIIVAEDGYRHSKWLSFMCVRLSIARNLLSSRGCIFISIDDNEQAQLRTLCDEIFGQYNFVSVLHWKKKKQPSYLHGHVAGVMEYILVYAKDKNNLGKLSLSSPSDSNTRVDNASNQEAERFIKGGILVKLPESVKVIKAGIYKNKTMSTEYLDDVYIENGKTLNGFRARARFRDSQDRIDRFCDEGVFFITKNYGFRRDKLQEELEKKKAITDLILDWGDNQDSDQEIKSIFGEKVFSYPKPTSLIENLVKATCLEDCLVLDFFAGSGTTAQSVLQLNKEDGGCRRFILCTNNQNNICEDITYPRIKTVITGKRRDGSIYSEGIPANLKYYKTDFISKGSDRLTDELIAHVDEMIQLEYGVKIDKDKYISVLTDEDADELSKNWESYPDIKAIFISRRVLLTGAQKRLFETKDNYVIPDYYFRDELREAGEA